MESTDFGFSSLMLVAYDVRFGFLRDIFPFSRTSLNLPVTRSILCLTLKEEHLTSLIIADVTNLPGNKSSTTQAP